MQAFYGDRRDSRTDVERRDVPFRVLGRRQVNLVPGKTRGEEVAGAAARDAIVIPRLHVGEGGIE